MKIKIVYLLAIVITVLYAAPVHAADPYTVSNNSDDVLVEHSLRQVITAANIAGGFQTIAFTGAIGTITLASALPTITCTPTFNLSGATGTVTLAGGTMGYGAVPFTFNGGGTLAIGTGAGMSGTGDPTVASTGTATLNVTSGGTVSSAQTSIGTSAGSNGTITINGSGSTWTGSNHFNVGNAGTGTLNIQNGGAASTTGSATIRIGTGAGSNGTVTVDGAGSTFTTLSYLQVGRSGTGTLTISNGGKVDTGLAYIGSNAGSVGTCTIDGAGSKWQSGGSDFLVGSSGAGTLTIQNGGAVISKYGEIGSAAGATGTCTIDGTSSSWTASNDFYIGTSGTGTLTLQNSALLNLTGTTAGTRTVYMAYAAGSTGTLNIGAGGAAGTIQAATVTGGLGTATLTFNHTDTSYTFSPAITGTFTNVNFNGTGKTILTGATTYTGNTTINAGTLDIGTNSLSIGAGVYTQAAGSRLNLTANSASSFGSIASASNAVVDDVSTVSVTVSGYLPNNASLTVIDGAGGAGVEVPGTITSSDSKVTFQGRSSNGDLILTASRSANGFASLAASGDSNASAVGAVLDNITSPSSDMTTVLNTIEGLSNTQTASALDTLVPEVDAGVINTTTTALNNFVGVSIDRVENVLTIAKAADSAATGVSAGEASKSSGIWAKGYGSYLTQGMRNSIAGYDAWNAGTALGADHLFADNITLGASGGWAYGNVDSDVNNGNTYINSAQATLYGGYSGQDLPYFIDAAGSFAYNWYNGTRDINVGNVIFRTANASYKGQQYGVYLGGGYKFNVTKSIEFTPLISLQYNHLALGSYTETEAGALDLAVDRQGYDQLQSGVGARIASPIQFAWGTFTPEAHGKWFFDFIGDPMAVTSNFNGGGASFGSNGVKPALNSFNAGGQMIFDLKNDVSIIGNCDTEMKDRFFGIYGSLTLRYDF